MPSVTVDGTDVVVATRAGEPILAALCRHGYAYRFGCRRGGCGMCKVTVLSGRIEYRVAVSAQILTSDDVQAGVCLSCRAVPQADTVIRLSPDDTLRCVAPFLAPAKSNTATSNTATSNTGAPKPSSPPASSNKQ
jgi:CDP-4-dehydro-6-deoxyglucose reductase